MAKGRRRRPEPRKKEPQYRINERIRVPQIRLVGDNIEVGIYPTRKALDIAYNKGLDLVEIAPTAKPPVCKVIDYKKFLYEKKRKEKEIKAKAAKTVVKEIRFGPNTDEHDFEFKAKHANRFLQEGAKVKAYVHFKGRSILFKERGELILLKFAQRLDEVGILEQFPKLEGKRMFVFLAPKKTPKPKVKVKSSPKKDNRKGNAKNETAKKDNVNEVVNQKDIESEVVNNEVVNNEIVNNEIVNQKDVNNEVVNNEDAKNDNINNVSIKNDDAPINNDKVSNEVVKKKIIKKIILKKRIIKKQVKKEIKKEI